VLLDFLKLATALAPLGRYEETALLYRDFSVAATQLKTSGDARITSPMMQNALDALNALGETLNQTLAQSTIVVDIGSKRALSMEVHGWPAAANQRFYRYITEYWNEAEKSKIGTVLAYLNHPQRLDFPPGQRVKMERVQVSTAALLRTALLCVEHGYMDPLSAELQHRLQGGLSGDACLVPEKTIHRLKERVALSDEDLFAAIQAPIAQSLAQHIRNDLGIMNKKWPVFRIDENSADYQPAHMFQADHPYQRALETTRSLLSGWSPALKEATLEALIAADDPKANNDKRLFVYAATTLPHVLLINGCNEEGWADLGDAALQRLITQLAALVRQQLTTR
jgi:hypothetical protein